MRLPLARFETVNTNRLRRLGLGGSSVMVSLNASTLSLVGSEHGILELPLRDIAWVRVGFEEHRYGPVLSVQLATRDGSPRIRLHEWHDRTAYAHFVRTLAVALLGTPGSAVVETGAGWFVPLLVFGLFGSLAAVAVIGAAREFAAGGDWVSPALAAGASAGLVLALRRWLARYYMPRRVTRPDDIERAFPPWRHRRAGHEVDGAEGPQPSFRRTDTKTPNQSGQLPVSSKKSSK